MRKRRMSIIVTPEFEEDLRDGPHLLSEKELLARCKRAEENYRKGNVKVLKTMKDIEQFFKRI